MPRPANEDPAPPPAARIGSQDLQAYVEGSLDAKRRSDVEGFLACNPDLAAQVMTGLHRRARFGGGPAPRRPRRAVALALGGLACLASGALGFAFAGAEDGSRAWRELDGDMAPAYVEEAVMSHRATLLRVAMASQPETATLDVDEIRRAMGLDLPALPPGWRLLDVQVYPSDAGPGVNLLITPSEGRQLNLFAVRADARAGARPEVAVQGRDALVYWERGATAFVLSGEGAREQLLAEAMALSKSRTL